MSSLGDYPQPSVIAGTLVDPPLFVWRGGGVILFGESQAEHWIVARGWLGPDTLTDIRRWRFTTPAAFGGQFRRLAREASAHPSEARSIGAAAARWALAASQRGLRRPK